jgi:hypothetical protein
MGYSFKDYILNEANAYFGERIGDLLNAVQDLVDNGSSMGTRQLVKKSEGIVNQIRRVLHTNWSKKEEKSLEKLQNIGCAISRAIEEKDDLINVLTSIKGNLEELSADLGMPVQKSGEEQPEEGGPEASQGQEQPEQPPEQPEQPPEQVPPQAPPLPGQPPQAPPQAPQGQPGAPPPPI